MAIHIKTASNQPTMTKKVFILQRVMLSILIISIFTKNEGNQLWVMLLELLAMTAMILLEGTKPYYPLYFMAIAAQFLNVVALQMVFLAFLTTYLLKYYFYQIQIFNKGSYEAGFRYCKIQEFEFAVFYPTSQKGKPAAWIQTDKYSKDLYDLTFMDPLKTRWIPYRLFKFFITYMDKYQIPAELDVRLSKINAQESSFPVIIFSHGLSSNMTSHSSYCCWLASQGFIVISMQHNHDLIRLVYDQQLLKRKEMLAKIFFYSRNHDLQTRSQEMERLYNSLVQGKLMKNIFPEEEEEISVQSIHLAGHSFGGATCLETLANMTAKKVDISLIKGAICIDPWVFPLSENTLNANLGVDITVINSQTFLERMPAEFQMRQKLLRISQNNSDNFKALVLMGFDHVFSTDFIFVCGNGVTKITKCLNYNESHTYFSLFQLITRLSIDGKDEGHILKECSSYISQNKANATNVQIKKEWQHDPIGQQLN